MARLDRGEDGSLSMSQDDEKEAEYRVVVRVPKSLRDAFVASCKGQDTTASRELRQHMRNYVKKNGQGNFNF